MLVLQQQSNNSGNKFLMLSAGLGCKELSGRPKNLWGVHNKMRQKRQELDRIYDLRAIRVIVEDKTDCYSVLRQVSGFAMGTQLSGHMCMWRSCLGLQFSGA